MKDEAKTSEMIEILEHSAQYMPTDPEERPVSPECLYAQLTTLT